MAFSMPPPARPFRLNVHVLPAEASNNLQIEPTRRFLQLTQRTTTLQQLCDEISVKHARQYGTPLDIKKCQEISGSDLDLEYKLGDVFEDHDVIRVIEAPVRGTFTREDSLFPESSLRPKNPNGGSKRARSSSVRPNSRDTHRDEHLPNKRQRISDPDHPVRSLERDLEDDDTTLVNGDVSPVVQVTDSQQLGATADDQAHVNGIRHSTPQNHINGFSQGSLGSPFHLPNSTIASPQLPMTKRPRSGSESSSHHLDDRSARSISVQLHRPASQHQSLSNQPNQNTAGRDSSLFTAVTTPLEAVIPNTPDRSNNSERLGSVSRGPIETGQNSSEQHARVDVYDDIETDTEAPSRIKTLKTTSSARRIRENRAREEEAEEKRRLSETKELAKRSREKEEADARAHEAAEAKRYSEQLLAEQKRKEQQAAEDERIRLEHQREEEAQEEERKQRQVEKDRRDEKKRQEEEKRKAEEDRQAEKKRQDEKERQAEKERKAQQMAEVRRVKDLEIEKKRTERAAHTAAQNEGKKLVKAAKVAEKERTMVRSTPNSASSKRSSEISTEPTDNVTIVFPPCISKRPEFTPELDDILIRARENDKDWPDILEQHFPSIIKVDVLKRRHRTVTIHRQTFLEKSGQNTPQNSTQAKHLTTPITSAFVPRRESSTVPIPSNGTVISSRSTAVSSPALVTSSPRPTNDVTISSQILPTKARRSVSFANESIPISGQKSPASLMAKGKSLISPESKKETPISAPKPKFSSTPVPAPKPKFSSSRPAPRAIPSSTPEGTSLKQTKLISPRLGITDVKPTAKVGTPGSKSTAKPAKNTPMKKYSRKNQAKLLPDANVSDNTHPKANVSSYVGDTEQERCRISQHEVASTDSSSDDESSDDEGSDDKSSDEIDEDLDEQSAKAQEPRGKAMAAKSKHLSEAKSSEKVVAQKKQSQSLSPEQSPTRDSRSPVAFMSKRASPTLSEMNSQDREDSHEVPPSDVSSSPPVLPDNQVSDMEADDQSIESEEDDLDQMKVDEGPATHRLPGGSSTLEQEMDDDQLQSQIRRDSSQRESLSSQHITSKAQTQSQANRPSYSSQFPSLVAMSKAQMEKVISSGSNKASKSESVKQAKIEESDTGSEEESEEESDESGSSSDDDAHLKKTVRSAGTDLTGKTGKRKGFSFGAISSKLTSKKK